MIKIKRIYAGIVAVAAHWRHLLLIVEGFLPFSPPDFCGNNGKKAIRELRFEFTHSGAVSYVSLIKCFLFAGTKAKRVI